MAWDQVEIDEAVSLLAKKFGADYDVSAESAVETKEVAPVDGWRQYEVVPGTRKAVITIAEQKE